MNSVVVDEHIHGEQTTRSLIPELGIGVGAVVVVVVSVLVTPLGDTVLSEVGPGVGASK